MTRVSKIGSYVPLGTTPLEQVRACLGPNPSVEARPKLAELLRSGGAQKTIWLRYDWIRSWAALGGLDFWDGEGGIELILEEVGT